MSFVNNLPTAGKTVFALLLLYWCFLLWQNRKKALKDYPPIAYETDPPLGEAFWRWSPPPDGIDLIIEQGENESRLRMTPVRSTNETLIGLCGLVMGALIAWVIGCYLFTPAAERGGPPAMMAGVVFFMGLLAYAMCATDTPVTAVIRTPDRLILFVRFSVFFHRKKTYKARHAKTLKFKSSVQGLLGMNTDQLRRLPDNKLIATRRFRLSKLFLLRCNPTEASWIAGGLNQWTEVVR